MRLPFLIPVILLAIGICVDLYILRIIRQRLCRRWLANAHIVVSIVFSLMLIAVMAIPTRGGNESSFDVMMWLLTAYISVYIPKYIFVIFDILASIPRLFKRQRIKPLTMIGFILALLAFATIWWGALINRNRLNITNQDIFIQDLPEAFEGYRIAQFSDFHVGTYGRDTSFVANVVRHINALSPDIIVFTGDLVSRRTAELLPFVETLSKLHAPDGVYSILGNHDYGDYYDWKTPADHQQNIDRLIQLQEQMGWKMLNNDHAEIRRGNDSIELIGVENVGDPPFRTYGSLEKAYPHIDDKNVKILLSHNPSHWVNDIADNSDKNIALTLAGHTHAMQISLFGVSPARMRYKTWGGLYKDSDGSHQLYVNIGVGTVGIPFRIGATPEITILTLHRKES